GLDEWILRKLPCYRLKQCKRGRTIAKLLQRLGASPSLAHRVASSGKGWWRLSLTRAVHQAMSQEWFASQGLVAVTGKYDALQHGTNRRIRQVPTGVGEAGAGEPRPRAGRRARQ